MYLTGQIVYRVARFKPIEEAVLSFEENKALKIFEFAETILKLQGGINSGQIALPNATQGYEDDKKAFADREEEMKEYIQRFYDQETTTPSYDAILKAYADYYNKSRTHPMVRSDNGNPYEHLLVEYDAKSDWDKTVMWVEYGGVFVLEAQDATIGAVSGNLSDCQGNVTATSGQLKKIQDEYDTEQYAQAGYTTHGVLSTADPIIFSCFFSIFEYSDALSGYISTMSDFKKLSYNVAHNLGNIYDLTEEGIYRSMKWSQGIWLTRDYWARMGFIFGANFQNLFEDPEEYYYVDPNKIDSIDRGL